MISGSYMPGHVFLFRGEGQGRYQAGVKLVGEDGKPVRQIASAVAVADWDRDGDPDLIVGNIEGEVWFLPSERSASGLVFGARQRVSAGGQPLKVDGDAGPAVADWDRDGIPDLLLGSDDGGVRFCKGSGERGIVQLAAALELVPPAKRDAWELRLETDDARALESALAVPWHRSKVCAADWNGDGRLDLLVGDYLSACGPEPELTAEQKATKAELEERRSQLYERNNRCYHRATAAARESLGLAEDGELDDEELEARLDEEVSRLIQADEEYRAVAEEIRALGDQMKPLCATRTSHGFVWVYLRKAEVETARR